MSPFKVARRDQWDDENCVVTWKIAHHPRSLRRPNDNFPRMGMILRLLAKNWESVELCFPTNWQFWMGTIGTHAAVLEPFSLLSHKEEDKEPFLLANLLLQIHFLRSRSGFRISARGYQKKSFYIFKKYGGRGTQLDFPYLTKNQYCWKTIRIQMGM